MRAYCEICGNSYSVFEMFNIEGKLVCKNCRLNMIRPAKVHSSPIKRARR
jgi:ribosome-binding protein aMBF1 (putative translation factor)